MENNFNKLTPAEDERLAMLAEEAGEIVQMVGKILRHGYESYHPDDVSKTTNRKLLQAELIDLQSITQAMVFECDINSWTDYAAQKAWQKKLNYTHHQ